jgi:predicted DNA-binding protein
MKKTQLSIVIPQEIKEKIKEIAKQENRSITKQIITMIEAYSNENKKAS